MKAQLLKSLPWGIALLFFCGLATSQVWLSHLRYETSQNSQKLSAEKQQLSAEITRLNLEVANLTRPERLRNVAISKLGMQPPSPMQVVRP